VDGEAAARIAPQDAQRVQRALEVYRLTGVPISQWQADTPHTREHYRWLRFALWPSSREHLRQRLQRRFQAMLRAGLVDEVTALYARGDLTARHSAMRAVGYRQLWRHCAGELSLEQASAAAITATAQLAKRQLTWLRRDSELTLLGDMSTAALDALTTQVCASAGA
jgi:tRNA dimethylallyltransferase